MAKRTIAILLDDIQEATEEYIAFQGLQSVAVTLWTANTHIYPQHNYVPYLAVTSPARGAGKSTLFDVLSCMVARPLILINPSPASMYHILDTFGPTMLLDEWDAIKRNEDLRAILNAGFQKGRPLPRKIGKNVEMFNVFGPKAFAAIGRLPDTVIDRSIEVRLQRKAPHQKITRFRKVEAGPALGNLKARLEDWADTTDLTGAKVQFPQELGPRAMDIWEPLFAIADSAGGDWPVMARKAAVELYQLHALEEEQPLEVQLLAAIRDVFGKEPRMHADVLVQALHNLDRQWMRLTPQKLAIMLRGFGVRPQQMRIGAQNRKGYMRVHFEDAWSRWL